ncbi:MAG: UvrD-helicase domain-containing protein [Candidatus Izimaplasma sp.]|nr:UvrD-helicase domain-containing protein [Candidatus Izimaplasma bacterium]
MHKLLQGLNEKQKEAVLKTEGPVMAIAGAGSGKTSVLTKRIAYLIYEKNIPIQNILAITFTNKAAEEMKDRIYEAIGIYSREMWISTFHSMCARILREHIDRLGYDRHFQIIDDDDTKQLVKNLLKKQNIDVKLFSPKTIRDMVLKAKQDNAYLDGIEMPLKDVVATTKEKYVAYLEESNLVDFDDLLLLTTRLLKEHDDIKAYYHDLFQYILVDEFQDTNDIQYDLVKTLTNKDENIFIVGDEDQSIYAFRGANIKNIQRFKKEFSHPHIVLLEQNYRSTNTILNAANAIIKHNQSRIPKNLFSTKGEGEKIIHYKGPTARDEVEYIAMTILKHVQKGYDYNDFAVLYRANSTSRQFEEVFMQKQMPYKLFGNTSFFKRKEIKDFTAYLRYLINPDDAFSFLRIISVPRRGIGAKTVEKIMDYAGEQSLALSDALNQADNYLSTRQANNIEEFVTMVNSLQQKLTDEPIDNIIDALLNDTGYVEMLKKDDKGDVRYENILELKTLLHESSETYKEFNKTEQLSFVLEDIALKSEETKEDVEDGVTLCTLHSAKGLEFRVVFIVALETGMFPLHQSMSDARALEEERRLMYVGVTRAKERLYLTNASVRQTYGQTNQNMDSPFLREIPEDYLDYEGYVQKRTYYQQSDRSHIKAKEQFIAKRKETLKTYTENTLNKGDKVIHDTFGDGVVVSVAGKQCVIAFSHGVGIKKLLKDHPAIKKK